MLGSSNSWTSIQPLDLEARHRAMLESDSYVSVVQVASPWRYEMFHQSSQLDHFFGICL